jgi:predicted RNase H-like HicB family nuclease
VIREFNVVIEKDEEGYFVASVPALRGCHTQAKSLDVLIKRIREAIELCLEVEEPVSNEFVGVQRIAVNLLTHGHLSFHHWRTAYTYLAQGRV